MKCPYCGNECAADALYCDVCKQPLPTAEAGPEKQKKRKRRTALQRILIILAWAMSFVAVGIGIYKLVFWMDSYKITRLYTRGAYTPMLNEVTMADGRLGHALIFYGEDGDLIYLPELNESLSICGGVARLEIADSDWFSESTTQYDYADINFAPVLIKADGTNVQLPVINYTIDVPESPITVLSPSVDGVEINTSSYPLQLQVVAGSSVYINGEDVTEKVDRSGALSVNVSVRPIGDNTYTVIVRTPQHKETRRDITIFRQQYDIEVELDQEVTTQSNETTMPISGHCEPGAYIVVETPYVEDSLMMDMTTGEFSFIAKFDQLGENIIRFKVLMEGREDATISFSVNYKPTLAQYSAKAWAMDYPQLSMYFENWMGRIFLCEGPIVDIFTLDDEQYLVMDVGTEGEQQLILLQNDTSITSPSIGQKYSAYADVIGREFYMTDYYPTLVARYMDLYTE